MAPAGVSSVSDNTVRIEPPDTVRVHVLGRYHLQLRLAVPIAPQAEAVKFKSRSGKLTMNCRVLSSDEVTMNSRARSRARSSAAAAAAAEAAAAEAEWQQQEGRAAAAAATTAAQVKSGKRQQQQQLKQQQARQEQVSGGASAVVFAAGQQGQQGGQQQQQQRHWKHTSANTLAGQQQQQQQHEEVEDKQGDVAGPQDIYTVYTQQNKMRRTSLQILHALIAAAQKDRQHANNPVGWWCTLFSMVCYWLLTLCETMLRWNDGRHGFVLHAHASRWLCDVNMHNSLCHDVSRDCKQVWARA